MKLRSNNKKAKKTDVTVVVGQRASKFTPPEWMKSKKFLLVSVVIAAVVVLFAVLALVGVFSSKTPTNKALANNSVANPLSYQDGLIKESKGDPTNQAQPYLSKAEYYLEKSNYKDALANAQKSNQLRPNNPSTLETIGDIYVSMGDAQQGVSYYQKDIELNSKSKSSASQKASTKNYYEQKITQAKSQTKK